MKKDQNRITEYRKMFQIWKEAGMVTYAGFIMGLPGDTPATIKRDIEIIQRELPVDLLEFTMLTPLPGSEDHKKKSRRGSGWTPTSTNTTSRPSRSHHPKMSAAEWQQTYADMWTWYYTRRARQRMMLRNKAYGIKPVRILRGVLQIYGAPHFEGVHPQQCGYFRRKDRTAAPARDEARGISAVLPPPRRRDGRRNTRSSASTGSS